MLTVSGVVLIPVRLIVKVFGFLGDISLLTVSLSHAIIPKSTINVR